MADHIDLLRALLPLAESRAEDLSEIAEETQDDEAFDESSQAGAKEDAEAAWASVEAARLVLAPVPALPPDAFGVSLQVISAGQRAMADAIALLVPGAVPAGCQEALLAAVAAAARDPLARLLVAAGGVPPVVLPAGLVDGDREDEARAIAARTQAAWGRRG